MRNLSDMVDSLLDSTIPQEETEEKVASTEDAPSEGISKFAEFLEFMAGEMEKAASLPPEALIPPDEQELGKEIQRVTGINKNEAMRAVASEAAPTEAPAEKQAEEAKEATSPEETRSALPASTPIPNQTMKSACQEANKLLTMGMLTGKWPAEVVKRLAE